MPRPAGRYRPNPRRPAPPRDGGLRLYDSAAWRKASKGYLAEHPLCLECCGRGRVESSEVVDHVTPHRGDPALFWDRTNWQPLCKRCHDRKTATTDGGFGRPTPNAGS